MIIDWINGSFFGFDSRPVILIILDNIQAYLYFFVFISIWEALKSKSTGLKWYRPRFTTTIPRFDLTIQGHNRDDGVPNP